MYDEDAECHGDDDESGYMSPDPESCDGEAVYSVSYGDAVSTENVDFSW